MVVDPYEEGDMEAYISDIEFAVGDRRELEDLAEHIPEKRISLFRKFGLKYYYEYSGSVYDIALEAAKKTVKGNEKDIGTLVFSTGSFHSPPSPYNRVDGIKDLNQLLKGLGIDAYPYGVYLSDCANIISAIRIGKNFLMEEQFENSLRQKNNHVCIITSDVTGVDESRIVPPGTSIKSDSASSCIISSKPRKNSFKIGDIHQYHNKEMLGNTALSYEDYIIQVSKCIDFIRKKNLDEKNQTFQHILTNNYSNSYIKTFSLSLLANEDIFYKEQIPNFAHCFSSDLLINLNQLCITRQLNHGDCILAIASGPSSISSICLEYIEQI